MQVVFKQGLRALLIQKDVKPELADKKAVEGLRALLIQKDVKLNFIIRPIARV